MFPFVKLSIEQHMLRRDPQRCTDDKKQKVHLIPRMYLVKLTLIDTSRKVSFINF